MAGQSKFSWIECAPFLRWCQNDTWTCHNLLLPSFTFSYSFILLLYLFMILPSPILKLWELWTCSSIEQGFMDSFTDFHPEKWHAFLWNVPFHIMLIRFCWFIETLAHLSEPRSTHWKARSYSIARSLGVQNLMPILTHGSTHGGLSNATATRLELPNTRRSFRLRRAAEIIPRSAWRSDAATRLTALATARASLGIVVWVAGTAMSLRLPQTLERESIIELKQLEVGKKNKKLFWGIHV